MVLKSWPNLQDMSKDKFKQIDNEQKLKAIRDLIEEWEMLLPPRLYAMLRNILDNKVS